MIDLAPARGIVSSVTTTAADPSMGSQQHDDPVDDNQNKSALPEMFG